MTDPLTHWAYVTFKIRQAQKEAKEKIMDAEGLNKKSMSDLEQQAFACMLDAETVSTEYGVVQKLYNDKPITFRPVRATRSQDGGFSLAQANTRRLNLAIKEKE